MFSVLPSCDPEGGKKGWMYEDGRSRSIASHKIENADVENDSREKL